MANERPEPNLREAEELVMSALAIPGKSGQEEQVAAFVRQVLKEAGAAPNSIRSDAANRHAPIRSETGNLILKLPGTIPGPRRLLMAHMDTVPICVGCEPVRRGHTVRSLHPHTGLGADDRAGVAVVLTTAVEVLRQRLPHPPLTFMWTVQEEIGLHGARLANLNLMGRPKMAFNWDGGAPEKLTIGATSGYRMDVTIEGKASHAGGAPEKGVSAIAIAALAISDLQQNGWHGQIAKSSNQGTSNVGLIQGGAATNVVADRVHAKIEARSHDASFRRRIVREIEAAFRRAAREVKNVDGTCGRVTFDGRVDYESFCLPTNEPCVQMAQAAAASIGLEADLAIANGGLDANWITARGIPTVSLGCGQTNQHMVTETLDLRHFRAACRIALRLATGTEC